MVSGWPSLWRPIAPAGYVSLGLVASDSPPDLDHHTCVCVLREYTTTAVARSCVASFPDALSLFMVDSPTKATLCGRGRLSLRTMMLLANPGIACVPAHAVLEKFAYDLI